MNLFHLKFAVITLSYFVSVETLYAQQTVGRTSIRYIETDTNQVQRLYEQEPIYRGIEYQRYPHYISKGIFYFKSDLLVPGNVQYYGRNYSNFPIIYDQVADELITQDISGTALITLYSPKVKSFTIHDSRFIYIPDSIEALASGFWQVLYESEYTILKKEVKRIAEDLTGGQLHRLIESKVSFGILRNGEYYDIKNRDALTHAFGKKGEAVSKFMKNNRRRFRKNSFEEVILEAARHAESLSEK